LGRQLVHVAAGNLDRALGRPQLAADDLQQGRLARAAGAEDGDDLAALDAQRQAAKDLEIAVRKVQVRDFDRAFHGRILTVDAHPYSHLTPDLVLDGVAAAGLRPDGRLLSLNSYENRVYQVWLEDETVVVAKFYRPGRWSDAQI